MKHWLWLALLPSLAFADSRPYNMRKDPVYLDVHPDKVIILPEHVEIAPSELSIPENEFEKFLGQFEEIRDIRYLLLVLRPGSGHLQRQLRPIIQRHDIDIGIEPLEAGRAISFEEMNKMNSTNPPEANLPDKLATPEPFYQLVLEGDSILFPDQRVMSRDELQTPGNAFETLVDELESHGGTNPCISFSTTAGNDLFFELMAILTTRAPQMTAHIHELIEAANPVLSPTPLEAQIEGKEPVFFECRNNQLFSISLDRLKQAAERKIAELREQAGGSENAFFKSAATTTLEIDGQRLDCTYALMEKYVLMADPNAAGYSIGDPRMESSDLWFGSRLAKLDPEKQSIRFLVRPDGFDAFRKARKVCWNAKLESSCELLDEKEPIMLGPGGEQLSY